MIRPKSTLKAICSGLWVRSLLHLVYRKSKESQPTLPLYTQTVNKRLLEQQVKISSTRGRKCSIERTLDPRQKGFFSLKKLTWIDSKKCPLYLSVCLPLCNSQSSLLYIHIYIYTLRSGLAPRCRTLFSEPLRPFLILSSCAPLSLLLSSISALYPF